MTTETYEDRKARQQQAEEEERIARETEIAEKMSKIRRWGRRLSKQDYREDLVFTDEDHREICRYGYPIPEVWEPDQRQVRCLHIRHGNGEELGPVRPSTILDGFGLDQIMRTIAEHGKGSTEPWT